jgi:hypothetical protein
VPERLIPQDASYRLDRFAFRVISEWPYGKEIREHFIDPLLFRAKRTLSNYRRATASGLKPPRGDSICPA